MAQEQAKQFGRIDGVELTGAVDVDRLAAVADRKQPELSIKADTQ